MAKTKEKEVKQSSEEQITKKAKTSKKKETKKTAAKVKEKLQLEAPVEKIKKEELCEPKEENINTKSVEEAIEEKIVEENINKAEKLLEEEKIIKEHELKESNKEVIENATKTISKEAKKAIRKEKRKRFFDNFIAFLILLLIIGGITAGGYYWYTKVYDPNKKFEFKNKTEEEQQEEKEEKVVLTPFVLKTDKSFEVINEKYIVEHNKTNKLYDLKGNLIAEAENDVYYAEGIDKKIYAYKNENAETESRVTLYEVKEDGLNEIIVLNESSVYFESIMYKDNGKEYLIAFGGVGGSSFEGYETYIYTLAGKNIKLENVTIIGDNESEGIVYNFYTNSSKNIVVKNKQNKMGVYNIEENKLAIEYDYNKLYSINETEFIAIKDGKTGIINTNLKKIIDFEYEFIENNGDFFVLNKNNKLALMDKNYKMITGFDFDYQGEEYYYNSCCRNNNSFIAFKKGDKYVLDISNDKSLDYDKYEKYIISSNGEYKTLVDVDLVYDYSEQLIYTYNNNTKVYTIYDENMEEKYTIDIKEYDIKQNTTPGLTLKNPNTLKLDGYKIYFDYETGENIKAPKEYVLTEGNLTIKYLSNKENVEIYIDDKLETTDKEYGKIIKTKNSFYYISNQVLVSFK